MKTDRVRRLIAVRAGQYAIFVLIFVLSLLGGRFAHAQASGGSISGLVSDASGARIVNCNVKVTNIETGVTRTVSTNGAGNYSAPNLLPGSYEITASAPGFGSKRLAGITITVGTAQTLDFSLGLSSRVEQVNVAADTQDLQTGTSDISGLVDKKTIQDLPLNGRSFSDLALLQPGVASIQTQANFTTGPDRGTRGFGSQLTVSGARPQQNNYLLNGTSLNDYANGSGSVLGGNLGVDAISEFTVITTNASAQYGRTSGGIINAVTRSGANAFHGSAYEFARNSFFDANDPFLGPIQFSRNQFGGSLGGPIKKDRTFFFGNYEGVRQTQGSSSVANVPSQDARNGIIHNPDGTTTTIAVDPEVSKYLALYPVQNGGFLPDASYAGGFNPNVGISNLSSPQIGNEDFAVVRVDHRLSNKDSMFVNYLFDRAPYTLPDSLNSLFVLSQTTRHVATIEETHTFSPTIVNTLRVGLNRTVAVNNVPAQAINPAAADPTISSVPGEYAPQVIVPNLTTYVGGINSNGTNYAWTSLQFGDDVFLTRGRHSIKAGFYFEGMRLNEFTRAAVNGQFQFTSLTGFLTNHPFIFDATTVPPTPRDLQEDIFAGYVQDDWRVTPKLTINIGLRYEASSVVHEAKGKLSNLVNLSDATPQLGSPFFKNPTTLNFEPRVGFSLDPFADGKTILRGGFGIYDVLPLPYLFILPASVAAPYAQIGVAAGPGLPAGSFYSTAQNALSPYFLTGAHVETSPKRDYVYQYNLNIQRQITNHLTLLVGFVGSRGLHQPYYTDQFNIVFPTQTAQGYQWPTAVDPATGQLVVNPPPPVNPGYGAIRGLEWKADSYYDGLQVGLHQSLNHGVQYQVSYTQSRSIDTSSASLAPDAFSNSIADLPFFAPSRGRGPSDFNVGRVLVVDVIAQVPHAQSDRAAVKWLTEGWQVGTILTAHDGVPFTPTYGSDGDPLGSSGAGGIGVGIQDYPDRLTGPGCSSLTNPGNPVNYVKNQCFAVPQVGLLGNAGRNILTGPGVLELDGSVFKNIQVPRVGDRIKVQFRAEAFNLLNHVNYANPGATDVFDSNNSPLSTSGQITGTTTPPRELQFGVKVLF